MIALAYLEQGMLVPESLHDKRAADLHLACRGLDTAAELREVVTTLLP